MVDLSFKVSGGAIPLNYGYALFGAISRLVPAIHGDRRIGVHPIRGLKLGRGRLTLVPQSHLRLRLPAEEVGAYLPLAGARLDLDGSAIEVGVPRAEALRAWPVLISRLVTIGHHRDSEGFLDSVRRQLDGLGVRATASFLPSPDSSRRGEPSRRILVVKGRRIVGFPLRIDGLTAEESLIVQEYGLGSHRRMGCGVFVKEGESPAHA
jgi:CRISPR-associated protein Cas6